MSNPWKFSLRKVYFLPICESFLPRKFSAMQCEAMFQWLHEVTPGYSPFFWQMWQNARWWLFVAVKPIATRSRTWFRISTLFLASFPGSPFRSVGAWERGYSILSKLTLRKLTKILCMQLAWKFPSFILHYWPFVALTSPLCGVAIFGEQIGQLPVDQGGTLRRKPLPQDDAHHTILPVTRVAFVMSVGAHK